jgi:hypothetical protein
MFFTLPRAIDPTCVRHTPSAKGSSLTPQSPRLTVRRSVLSLHCGRGWAGWVLIPPVLWGWLLLLRVVLGRGALVSAVGVHWLARGRGVSSVRVRCLAVTGVLVLTSA